MENKTFIHRLQGAEGFLFLSLPKENHFALHLVKRGFVRGLQFSQSDREKLKELQANGQLLGFVFDKEDQLSLHISSNYEEDRTMRELSKINPFAQFSINMDGFNSFGITPVESEPFTDIKPELIEIIESEIFEEIWKEAIIKGDLERMEKKRPTHKM